ncbi:hypothetical protein [Roseomonas fluvialis]|uniref:GNAT family N-acetyltransferase n=1 Tax=Roseomonas fluvialis TaxID=1750527 RepID=A0ABM7XYW7_9PROT|nr:hypothetical protein [Roseomonas fluvialis]BDG70678.1 hypothetical protein Rmf_06070 [Roseomonas fluvialis]
MPATHRIVPDGEDLFALARIDDRRVAYDAALLAQANGPGAVETPGGGVA